MAHEVESMFYVEEVPWHGLGKQVEKGISTKQAIVEAGLDWKVSTVPLYTGEDYGTQQVSHRAIIRESDKSVLSVCGPDYHVLQNQEAFNFFDPYIDAGEAFLHTAGSLRQGRDIWVLAKLNRDPIQITKDDIVDKYLLLSNSHKSGIAVKVGFTPIRVVCANTLAMASSNQDSQLIRVIHGKQVLENLSAIREVINAADARFEATSEQYRYLASKQINRKDLQKFIKLVFIQKEPETERQIKAADKIINDLTRIFETGYGNELPGVKGTAWAMYNSVTEYLSHEVSDNNEKKISSLWYGANHDKNAKALKAALEVVA